MALVKNFESLAPMCSTEYHRNEIINEIIKLFDDAIPSTLTPSSEDIKHIFVLPEIISNITDIVEQIPAKHRTKFLTIELYPRLSKWFIRKGIYYNDEILGDNYIKMLASIITELAERLEQARAGEYIPAVEESKGLLNVIEEDTRKKAMSQINAENTIMPSTE